VESFHYKRTKLYCEDMQIAEVARRAGTPFYLYSQGAVEQKFKTFEAAFADIHHLTCYAVKANSNLAILNFLRALGAGFDIVSGGELLRALEVGADPQKIIFSGVGKKQEEIDLGLNRGIHQFNVESAEEIKILLARARALDLIAPVTFRLNPDVDAHTHPYQSTGMNQPKFGIPLTQAVDLCQMAKRSRRLRLTGIGVHIGSQITRLAPFVKAVRCMKDVIERVRDLGIKIQNLDIGGGLGIRYRSEVPPSIDQYARAVKRHIRDLDCTLLLEPGRALVAEAGVLVTRVLAVKEHRKKRFVVVDAAVNDLMRPSMYGAYHQIQHEKLASRGMWKADVVGPVCETGDFLAKGRKMPMVRVKELLVIRNAGAYCFTQSSNYNSRPRVPEVLVQGGSYRIIRKRETFQDLIRGESMNYLRNGARGCNRE